jgi:hypothetical protein
MNKIREIALGIVTSIGGFLDVGAIATAAEAGSTFEFQLIWTIVLGTICVIALVEMSGRLAAVSKHTLADAVRERLGFNFFIFPLIAEIIVATNFIFNGIDCRNFTADDYPVLGLDERSRVCGRPLQRLDQ